MTTEEKLPVFPFVPDKVSETHFRIFEHGDFPSAAAAHDLVQLMWEEPETTFYYYSPTTGPTEESLLALKQSGVIQMAEMERRHYRHPKFERDYVRVVESESGYRWDWEREVVNKGPEYWKVKLTLSARTRNELDTRHKVELEDFYRSKLQEAKYSFDAFLSYSTANSAEAEFIHSKASTAGLRVFMAPKHVVPGDDFAEEIRCALEGAKELWLLLSPQSARSEWVISEWGAAWVLKRTIVPILHRCAPDALPDRLARFQCIDLHRIDELISSRAQTRAKING